MPSRKTRQVDGQWVHMVPLGVGGLDYQTSPALLPPETLAVGENIRFDSGVLSRRLGRRKVYSSSDPCGSKTFGATSKYATIPAASQLELAAGGWALNLHFTAVRPSGGNTAYILSSRVNGQSYHVLSVTLSDAGVITVTVQFTSGGSQSIACDAVDAAATVHLLVVHDAPEGTMTAYVNGAASGTAVTGLSTSDKPVTGSGDDWHIGVHYNPATAGVVANTNFDGKVDGMTLFTLAGTRPSGGSPSLTDTLVKHSFRQWPSPWMDFVLACYDFDESSTSSMTDRSRFENTATLTGTPTNTAAVAYSSIPSNYVGFAQFASGRKPNFFASYGRLFYENVALATS